MNPYRDMQTPTKKRLMMLGGSLYQIPFIKAARRCGAEVVTVDNRPENPGHLLSDYYLHCDTTDVRSIESAASEWNVDGIVAAATDVALDSVAAVATSLGLRGPSIACARVLTRKREFRLLQARLELPHPTIFEAECEYPCIVKPNRASGSKGTRIVDDRQSQADAMEEARRFSIDHHALSEEYLPGIQGTAEGVLRGGRIHACLITKRETAPTPYVATVAHTVPSGLEVEVEREIYRQITRVFNSLDYLDGPFDCDFVVHGNEVVLIEITPRAGGNSLVKLLEASVGFDMPSYVVRHALGIPYEFESFKPVPASVMVLGTMNDGILDYDTRELHALRREPWMFSIEVDHPPGTSVHAYTDGRHRCGDFTVVGPSPSVVASRIAEVLKRLALTARV